MTADPTPPAPLDTLRRAVRAGTPLAPVHAATGARLLSVEPGHCTAVLPGVAADPDLGLWVLADFVVGLCVTGTIAAGERIATLRLDLQALTPEPPPGELRAVGELVHTADGTALSRAVITGDGGRAVAVGTGRNAILRDAAGDTFDDTPPAFDDPPRPLLDVRDDAGTLVARPHAASANSAGVVQGGVLAAVASRALARELGARPQEMAATFVRATPAGDDVRAEAVVEHAGRRLRSGRVAVTDGRGKPVVTASGMAYAGSYAGA